MNHLQAAFDSFIEKTDGRMRAWLLYRLRGGKDESLWAIVAAGHLPVVERYRQLLQELRNGVPYSPKAPAGAPVPSQKTLTHAQILASRARAELADWDVAILDCSELARGVRLTLSREFLIALTRDLIDELLLLLWRPHSDHPENQGIGEHASQLGIQVNWHSLLAEQLFSAPSSLLTSEDLFYPGLFYNRAGRETSWHELVELIARAMSPPAQYFTGTRVEQYGYGIDENQIIPLLLEELGLPQKLGAYRIIALLGHHVKKTTLLAEDPSTAINSKVVIKIIRDHPEREPVLPIRGLTDPYTYPEQPGSEIFVDVQTASGIVFVVTKFVDGDGLEKIIDEAKGSEKARVAIRILRGVCAALADAHSQGMCHNNLKTKNILVSKDLRTIKLSDFTKLQLDPHEAFARDVISLGEIFSKLLQNDRAAGEQVVPIWLSDLLELCTSPGSGSCRQLSDAMELMQQLEAFIKPESAKRVTLIATSADQGRRIEYRLEIEGRVIPQLFCSHVNQPVRDALFGLWQRLGHLALRRLKTSVAEHHGEIDQEIRRELGVLKNASTDIFGPGIRNHVKSYRLFSRSFSRASHLIVSHDPDLAAIPWELLEMIELPTCRAFPMARLPELNRLHTRPRGFVRGKKLQVLLIADPTGELTMTTHECECVARVFRGSSWARAEQLEVKTIEVGESVLEMRELMRSSDIIHFAGHGIVFHGEKDFSRSALLLKGSVDDLDNADLLTSNEIVELWQDSAPLLIFAHGCATAPTATKSTKTLRHGDATRGLATAALSAGVGCFIGALWKTPDNEPSLDFAQTFYRELISGCSVAQSVFAARKACISAYGETDLTWARYILFGEPTTNIPMELPDEI